ncbi:MAG: DNA polymerase IV [Anaerovoracaceae bacterium]|nr:DNA polymerase IV [Bacillota bacterium]MDY2669982.1 DNA polymerase IV [Anaerovoracaceae bacterium]
MAEKRTIFHIDVNSAFLSWTSAHNIENGKGPDLRKMAAVIGGDRDSRHGIVLAKSDAAKKAGIHTAMTISEALTLCPNLVTAPPDFRIYRAYSARLMKYLRTLTPLVEQASIDEAYLDLSSRPEISAAPVEAAYRIKDHIRNSFGFTVNVGISENKVLAKMASDFEKPDRVHTLFKNEIREKMWPLPVSELYMAGRSSVRKLKEMGINDIGDLARSDPALIERRLKSHGRMLWLFANGIDDSPVKAVREEPKGIGSSTTLPVDVTAPEEADRVLKELCAQVSRRLDKAGYMAGNICVEIKYSDFSKSSRQHMLSSPVSSADRLLAECTDIFRELWDGSPVRLLGVRASKLVRHGTPVQISIMDMASPEYQKEDRLESTLEEIKKRYGQGSVKRGSELEKR